MIGRANRFHGYNSLRFVYRRGDTVRTSLFALKYMANSRRSDYRLSVVVSKKVSKSAVVRNRIRRRLYEVMRAHGHEFNGAYDLVITAFSDQLKTIPAKELETSVVDCLKQAKIIS